MVDNGTKPTTPEIEEELRRILSRKCLPRRSGARPFCAMWWSGLSTDTPDPLKEFSIAIDVFARGHDYDPSIDATVRVEAGRLRSRLREYYDGEGSSDPVYIDVPKGGYHPAFTFREAKIGAAKEVPQIVGQPEPVETTAGRWSPLSWGRWVVVGVLLLALVAAGVWRWRPSSQQI